MEFLKVFFQRSKWFYVFLVLLSIINGLLNTGVLMFINNTISGVKLFMFPEYDWAVFIVLILFSLTVTKVFQTFLIRLTTEINFDFELTILKKLKSATFEDFEKLGIERAFTAIGDIRVLANLPEVFMSAINSLIIVVCCFIYLFWISWVGSLAILCLMVFLFLFYMFRNKKIEKMLDELRSLMNHYFRYFNDLLQGFKEVKISSVRNENIYNKFLKENLSSRKNLSLKSSIRYMNNELTGSYSWYLVLGVIMFGLPRITSLNIADVSAFLVTILFFDGTGSGFDHSGSYLYPRKDCPG